MPGHSQDYLPLINAELQILGVPEVTDPAASGLPRQHLWVAAKEDVQVVKTGLWAPLQTVRTLYTDQSVKSGHLVRVRGTVIETAAGSLVIADGWGTLGCELADRQLVPLGARVEVEGFPKWDRIRAYLVDARPHVLPAAPAPDRSAAEASPSPLTSVRAVRQLSSAKAAEALPVRLTGVLTYVDPIWQQFYFQDQTGGIYVKFSGHPKIADGDRVALVGLTGSGDFAPVVLTPKLKVTGTGALPRPVPAEGTQAAAGILDSQFVSIEGIVHPIKVAEDPDHPIFTFELASSLGQIHVYTSPLFSDASRGRRFEDARVRIHGVFGTVFNNRRQLIGYQLLVGSPDQVEVLDPPAPDPFALPPTPIQALLRFSPGSPYGHRVKVAGTVSLVGRDFLYLQDATSGVEVRGDTSSIRVGDRIQAAGYPTLVGRYSPVMTDAAFRMQGHGNAVPARNTTAESAVGGQDDSNLVTVDGRLLTKLEEPGRMTLILQSGIRTFTAQLDRADLADDLSELRTDSVLRLTGVCVSQLQADKVYTVLQHQPITFQILLRSPSDIAILHQAPFWTLRIAMGLLVLAGLLVPTILVWVAVLRRRVHLQREALRKAEETAQAIQDLSASMQNVAQQQFDAEVSVRGSEPIAQLVVGFNEMLAELRLRDQAKRAAEAKLQNMAMFDELTGLPNRRMLFESLSQSLARARRDSCKLGLLYIDLDGFKSVNDNLGHNIGDLLLEQVARRLRTRTRGSDTLARIGGDEFTVILSRLNAESDADAAARSLLDALTAPFLVNGHSIRIGASIGITIYPDHASESGQLLQQADCAMYAAKHNGKNRIVHFGDDLGNAARERITLESELRRAVAEHSITLHYQPEFDLRTKQIVRFEALARWHHPTLGSISPLHFIPIAEDTGLIGPLGAQILEQACRNALKWNAAAGRAIPVAVNVSSVQFAHESFVEEISEILTRTGLNPRLLQIELTESATLARMEHSIEVMNRLKKMGVTLAIDDFGTGYSCLSYLPRLPFDVLKIDRSFVNELTVNPGAAMLVQSIVMMTHQLGMRVIMEGIETHEELNAVTALGADEAQGYLLGRPLPDPLAHLGISIHAREKTTRPRRDASAMPVSIPQLLAASEGSVE